MVHLHKTTAHLISVSFAILVASSCNPNPPRKPATTKKADPSVPGASSPTVSPGSIFSQVETPIPSNEGELDANGNPVNPRQTGTPLPVGSASPTPPTNGNVPGSSPALPGSSPAVGSPSPSPSVAPTGAGSSPTPPADPVITTGPQGAPTLLYRTFFKPAEPGVVGKQQGAGWNLVCMSLKNESGTVIESSVCNKRISNSCYVYHGGNYGIQKSVNSSLIDNGLEIRLAITTGASYCADGQAIPNTDARKDSLGFIYLNGTTAATPEIVSSTSNPSLERFKCAKKAVAGGFKYKVCMEDAKAAYNSDPVAWDFNDFVLILESSKDLTIAGVNCVENGSVLNLPDTTCK